MQSDRLPNILVSRVDQTFTSYTDQHEGMSVQKGKMHRRE